MVNVQVQIASWWKFRLSLNHVHAGEGCMTINKQIKIWSSLSALSLRLHHHQRAGWVRFDSLLFALALPQQLAFHGCEDWNAVVNDDMNESHDNDNGGWMILVQIVSNNIIIIPYLRFSWWMLLYVDFIFWLFGHLGLFPFRAFPVCWGFPILGLFPFGSRHSDLICVGAIEGFACGLAFSWLMAWVSPQERALREKCVQRIARHSLLALQFNFGLTLQSCSLVFSQFE